MVERVLDILKEVGRNGISAEDLALRMGSNSKDLNHAGWDYIYELKQRIPKLKSKIDKKWHAKTKEYRYYLVDIDKERLYRAATEMSEVLFTDVKPKEGVDVILESNDDILIVIASDLHIGHPHSAYREIERAFKTIGEHDNIYLIGLGDLIDNSGNTHAPQGAENILDKNAQLSIIEYLFELLRDDSILRMYVGNHEIRSWKSDHFRIDKWLALNYGSSVGYFSEPFIIEIGGEQFNFFLRHKATGSSQFNPLHSCVRAVLFDNAKHARDADVIVTAHSHESAVGSWVVGGKMRYMIATDCMVEHDAYAEQVGYVSGSTLKMPAIYLRRGKEPMLYADFYEAIEDWF